MISIRAFFDRSSSFVVGRCRRPLQQRAMKTIPWIPHIEVYYEEKRMWWSMPYLDTVEIMSKVDMETYTCEYKWDQRKESGWNRGTAWEGGYRTSFNKYKLDFMAETRTNVDTGMVRRIRIIWTEAPQEVQQLLALSESFGFV